MPAKKKILVYASEGNKNADALLSFLQPLFPSIEVARNIRRDLPLLNITEYPEYHCIVIINNIFSYPEKWASILNYIQTGGSVLSFYLPYAVFKLGEDEKFSMVKDEYLTRELYSRFFTWDFDTKAYGRDGSQIIRFDRNGQCPPSGHADAVKQRIWTGINTVSFDNCRVLELQNNAKSIHPLITGSNSLVSYELDYYETEGNQDWVFAFIDETFGGKFAYVPMGLALNNAENYQFVKNLLDVLLE